MSESCGNWREGGKEREKKGDKERERETMIWLSVCGKEWLDRVKSGKAA